MSKKPMKDAKPGAAKVEGEGSYVAADRYDKGVRDFAKSGAVPKAAKDAADAVEKDGKALKQAETEGKRGAPRGA